MVSGNSVKFWEIGCISILAGVLLSPGFGYAQDLQTAGNLSARSLAALPNGNYQLCTEPEPQDWQDGAGVCWIFTKTGQQVSGYYGYPHSDSFVCVCGELEGDRMVGQGLTAIWAGGTWPDIPQEEFIWDAEGHLRLSQGQMIPGASGAAGVDWLLFNSASLEINGFYQYSVPRMRPANELCDWQVAAQ